MKQETKLPLPLRGRRRWEPQWCVCVYPGVVQGEAAHVVVDQAEGKTSVHEGEAALQLPVGKTGVYAVGQ